jgi:hypothetical protein
MSLAAFRFNRSFRLAAWLALWAVLLPALLPLVHHPAALAGAMQPICHMAMGGGDQSSAPEQEKSKPCPICQGLSTFAQGFVAPELVTLAVIEPTSVAVAQARQSFVVFIPAAAAWPRAPPALA